MARIQRGFQREEGLSKGQAGYVEWALGLPASGIKEILTYRIEKTRFECNKAS